MRTTSANEPSRGRRLTRRLSEVVTESGETVLRFCEDGRSPLRSHIFYPGGYLPSMIKKEIQHAKRRK